MLAQVFKWLGGVLCQDDKLVDFPEDVGLLNVLATQADSIDVGQGIGDASDGYKIVSRAAAGLTALEVNHLDGRHPGDEPGMLIVNLYEFACGTVPQLDGFRHALD